MPVATITAVKTTQFSEGNISKVIGTLSFSSASDTYTTGGITFPLSPSGVKGTRPPRQLEIMGKNGYIYQYVKGSSINNGLLKIMTGAAAQSPLTELTNAATIPAAVISDTIDFSAILDGML
jgi:hypothetical protein